MTLMTYEKLNVFDDETQTPLLKQEFGEHGFIFILQIGPV